MQVTPQRPAIGGLNRRAGEARAAATAVLDPTGVIVELLAPAEVSRPFGIPRERLRAATSLCDLCRELRLLELSDAIAAVVDGGNRARTVRITVPDEETSSTWEATVTIQAESDRILVSGFDVSELEKEFGVLTRRVHVDELTGVANRAAAMERIAADLHAALPVAALLIDVDHLKFVNDTLGHDAGDAMLVQIAKRLVTVTANDGLVGRLGGDEFIVVREYASEAEARELSEQIRAAVRAPLDMKGKQFTASVSIGAALSIENHQKPEDLLRDADVALYLAKARGRDNVGVFSREERERVARAVRIESELREALDTGALTIAVQPIIDMQTRSVVGGEAFIRWPLPNGQVRSPNEFLDIASESGLIGDVDRFVLDATCAALARFRDEMETPPKFICTNLSLPMLAHDDFVDVLTAAVRSHDLTPAAICLDIPETVLARNDSSLHATLDAVRAAGAYVALDDFGTGWSSLGALRDLPVDVLKIDRSFVDGLGVDPNDTAIVTAIMSLAHAVGLHVVAEGVETWAQVSELVRLGCPVMQGYRLGRPVAVERFASASAWAIDEIPDRRRLTRAADDLERAAWRGQPTFIDEFLHQLNAPKGSS